MDTFIKERPILFSAPMVNAIRAGRKHVTRRLSKQWLKVKAGDRLWVRETWIEGFATGEPNRWSCLRPTQLKEHHGKPFYRADGEDPADEPQRPWRPSIHMPRWASRILLECEEDARLERLRDITDAEAIAEGIEAFDFPVPPNPPDQVQRMYGTVAYFPQTEYTAVKALARLWQILHTKPGERWEDNPEVVRVGRFNIVKPDRNNGAQGSRNA